MFGLAVALVIGGYAVCYYGVLNLKSGGKGPTFKDAVGLKSDLKVDNVSTDSTPNLTGQPPSTPNTPPGGVWV